MEQEIQIYVRLLEEGTDTIRPTLAKDLGNNLYEILPTHNYNPEDEIWEFLPGSIVRLQRQKNDILLAYELIKLNSTKS